MTRSGPNTKAVFLTILVLVLGAILAVACQSNQAVDLLDATKEPTQSHDHTDDDPEPHLSSPLQEDFEAQIEEETGFEMSDHEASEGPMLNSSDDENDEVLFNAQPCPDDVEVKYYDVVAIDVVMVLNRWGDRDPEAYMYTLRQNVPAIRAQEAMINDEAEHFGLSLGLGNDMIQPLTIRANVGDCIRILFGNELTQPASFHVNGADLVVADTWEPALSSNPDTIVLPGQDVALEWYIDPTYYQENTHYVHSHGPNARYIVSHGLFGSILVEPAGSTYFDNRTGEALCQPDEDNVQQCNSSWDAMISPGDGSSDFREFAMYYHEIGNARFSVVDKNGIPNPNIDPITHSYKPNGRGINYRSESFFRRMGVTEELFGLSDESQAYGTYAFGDPAMPVPQTYLGDPTKFRLIHGGSETLHVPHLHGGGIQWQRQQDVGKDGASDYTPIDAGLTKSFENSMPSSGNDSQTISPSETYEMEIACGAGGCQQTAGDFLFHCHVASHYISGMWHFWRTYNTLQDVANKTDELAVLAELPDREGTMLAAVNSEELLGETVSFAGQNIEVTEENLADIIETQLPPQGKPNHLLDAAVLDWVAEGNLYLNEPDSELVWENYASETPGERHPFRFDPGTGKLAFPFLKPHLGQRPPFAPNNGPAPYLEPLESARGEPAEPGTNGDDSLCPEGAPRRLYKLHAIQTEIPVTYNVTDPDGMIFVLKENEELARGDPEYKVPLAIRANQGDCVDIILVNELEETGESAELSKTNIHIHFVQFDTQASDGVISGASYEQSPRPFIDPEMSFLLIANAAAGDTQISLDDASSFHVGSTIGIGMDEDVDVFETAVIAGIDGNVITLTDPLLNSHTVDEQVSVEFVRYRWYVARQNGAIYFHDHVDALVRWGHGLFGALIAEPTGSTYHHPQTGEEIGSGPIADIHTGGQVLPGLNGSFREYVLFMTDDNPYTGSAFNLRAEPLYIDTSRGLGPANLALSSVMHGDPATPLLQAYVGDPVMFRLLTSATEEVHPFHITGHTFRWERFQEGSPPLTVFGVGISERFNAYVAAAGGDAGQAGDYLYYNGSERHFKEGSWGIFRVYDTLNENLQPLPDLTPPTGAGFPSLSFTGEEPPKAASPGNPCPSTAPIRSFEVSAIEQPLIFNAEAGLGIPNGRIYVLDADIDATLTGQKVPEPLVIRANDGDCIEVQFTNRMEFSPASFHVDSPTLDPTTSLGITLGYNFDQSVYPGETITYRFFAQEELGAVQIRDFGNVFDNARLGLYGSLIVEPAGSTYHDPYTGEEIESGVTAVIRNPNMPDFREFVTVFMDSDPDIGLFLMPYDEEVNRLIGVNYAAAPLLLRLSQIDTILDADKIPEQYLNRSRHLYDSDVFGDPSTDVFETYPGEPVRFRVVSGYSEQPQAFTIEGHEWLLTPTIPGSDVVSTRYLPPTAVLNIELLSTGGPRHQPGDYRWGNQRLPFERAGQWGFMRILDPREESALLPLDN